MRTALVGLAVSVLATAGCGGGGTAATGAGGGGGGGSGAPGEVRRTLVIPHVLETSGSIGRVAAGDVDGDGVVDLLVFNQATSSLDLLLSTKLRESPSRPSLGKGRLVQGDGAFQPTQHVFVWDSMTDLCTGDLDGDGALDVCVAGGSSNHLGIWPGSPAEMGRLGQPVLIDLAMPVTRVALGDLDGDCDCDVVCLDESTGQLKLLLRSPGLSPPFVLGNDPPALGECRGLVVLDLDLDGSLDIVTNRFGADAVTIFELDAVGVFSPRDVATGQATGRAMGVGDLDGDGWPDVVLCSENGRSLVSLHQRSSAPGFFDVFVSDLSIAVEEQGIQVSQISIDEPGVHVHLRESPTLRSHLRESPSRPSLGGTLRLGMTQPGIGLCDFDRDGHLDVLMPPASGDPDFDLLMIYGIRESPTRFSFTERTRDQATGQSTGKRQHACIADLDGDGFTDMVTGDPDFDLLRLCYTGSPTGPGSPSFAERIRESPTKHCSGMVTLDLDRDGRLDVVRSSATGLEICYQDPQGRLRTTLTLGPAQSFMCVAAGDVNRDGRPDIVAATAQQLVVVLADPAVPRSFQAPFVWQAPGGSFRSLTLTDLDCNGHVDCVAIRESPSKASFARGASNGFFDVFTEIAVGVADPRAAAVGDLNGDGRPDLAVCGSDSTSVVLQDPAAPGSFGIYALYSTQKGARVALGDVDDDGRLDVVTTGQDGCIVSLQDPVKRGRFLPSYSLFQEACGGLALGDFNRDGLLDVCTTLVVTGTLVVGTGDPDFDLLRVVALNGLPPGVPFESMLLSSGDLDGDGKPDVVTFCPTAPGAADSRLMTFGDSP